jgi:alkylation response protein AidB-like acyl-CoA dehydrogenase
MEFALSEDQRLLQGSISGTLASVSSLDEVRKVAEGEAGVALGMSGALSELGAPQLLVPEPHGGLGLGALEAALVQEALGAHVCPAHFMAGSAMAVEAIKVAGNEGQTANWLGQIAGGDMHVGVALTEAVNQREGAGLSFKAGKLSGRALFALETDAASHILTCDAADKLYLVASDADGLSQRQLSTIDRTRSFAELVFKDVEAEALGSSTGGRALDRIIALGRILLAADTLGAAQVMLDKAVAYAGERKQFGRVIGSFQAVKHMCAEMAAKLEPARALVWHAAYLFDTDPEKAAVMACLAKSHLSEASTFIARTSTEVHGGMGFTDLVGLHYWFKRIGVNRQLLGGPEQLREEAARLQGWA